jgi:hypothetical protein
MLFGGNARMSVKLFHILSDIFYPWILKMDFKCTSGYFLHFPSCHH